jgi:hypothetical protein
MSGRPPIGGLETTGVKSANTIWDYLIRID